MRGSVFGTESICTNRPFLQGATLAGSNGNYVIDGNPTPERSNSLGIVIEGGLNGRNVLLGTTANDTLKGGNKHDALIGRGGDDQIEGQAGDDSILPWSSANNEAGEIDVNGGPDFDRIYLLNTQSDYKLTSDCDDVYCRIETQNGNGILRLKNIEQIIYSNAINTLRQ